MSRLTERDQPENRVAEVDRPAARMRERALCTSREASFLNSGNKKPATFALGLRQRLGRYAGDEDTPLLGLVNNSLYELIPHLRVTTSPNSRHRPIFGSRDRFAFERLFSRRPS